MERKKIVTAIKAKPQFEFNSPSQFVKRRTAAYVRVSTSSEEQLNSYEAQKDYYPKFIASHSNWKYVGLYCDEGLSGTSSKGRPEFNRMIADALDAKIDLIVTKSISRFARNTLDTLVIVRQLKEVGCEVWFEKENLYSCDSKGEFILTLLSSMAQEESRSLSENVKWGVRKRFADGKYSMPYAHFLGYQRGRDGKPEIVEEEAKIIRLIYRLYLEGNSVLGIAKYLTNHGVPTPSGKVQWQHQVVESILTNEKYYGAALLQKRFIEDYLTKKARKNMGELPQFFIENDHEPIICETIFMEARRRMESESFINPLMRAFSNKLICSECKSKYGSKPVGGYKEPRPGHTRYTVWHCGRRYIIPHERRMPTISENLMNHLFGAAIQELWIWTPGLRGLIQKSLRSALSPEKRTSHMRMINAFLDNFARIYPQDLVVDHAAAQVILDFGEVTPERTIKFHFINGKCITCRIQPRNKLPSKTKNNSPSGKP